MLRFVALIAIAFVGRIVADGDSEQAASGVVELTWDTYFSEVVDANNTVIGNKEWLIKFYAPWCGYCKKIAPTWDEIHEKHGENINVAKVDCTNKASIELCGMFGIRAYPSIKLLHSKSVYTFRGPRTYDSFVDFSVNAQYIQNKEYDIEEIPRALEGLEKLQKEVGQFMKQMAEGIDKMAVKVKLGFIPPFVRYTMVLLMTMLPCFALCYVFFFDSDDDELEEVEAPKKVAPTTSEPAKQKREKIE